MLWFGPDKKLSGYNYMVCPFYTIKNKSNSISRKCKGIIITHNNVNENDKRN